MDPVSGGLLLIGAYLLFRISRKTSKSSQIVSSDRRLREDANMTNYRAYYRTSDGGSDYYFSFEHQPDGTWRAYIENQPSYRGRSTDAHVTHRLSDGSRRYVCWTTPLGSLEDAKQVAALWADKTQEYIKTGKGF